jgi:hypothetical protein
MFLGFIEPLAKVITKICLRGKTQTVRNADLTDICESIV